MRGDGELSKTYKADELIPKTDNPKRNAKTPEQLAAWHEREAKRLKHNLGAQERIAENEAKYTIGGEVLRVFGDWHEFNFDAFAAYCDQYKQALSNLRTQRLETSQAKARIETFKAEAGKRAEARRGSNNAY